MGGEVVIDTDFVHWFKGYDPKPIIGPCPHDCKHRGISDIAWGPDLDHYTLDECTDCGCRAWMRAEPPKRTCLNWKEGPWMQVEPALPGNDRSGP